jgi:hypothetical protein
MTSWRLACYLLRPKTVQINCGRLRLRPDRKILAKAGNIQGSRACCDRWREAILVGGFAARLPNTAPVIRKSAGDIRTAPGPRQRETRC